MAKGAYIGESGKARKIKKGYIGIESKARKIKKGYIGVGGVARPCWGEGKLVYFGKISPLDKPRRNASGEYVGNYFIIAGGKKNYYGSGMNAVDAYDKNFVKTSIAALSEGRASISKAGILDEKAIFLGGGVNNSNYDSYGSNKIDTYSRELVHQYTDMEFRIHYNSGGRAGNAAIFTTAFKGSAYSSEVYRFDSEMVMTKLQNWDSGRQFQGESTGNYFVMTGYTANAAAWNEEGVRTDLPKYPSDNLGERAPARAGDNAVFAGGSWTGFLDYVGTYSNSLVFKQWPNLPRSANDVGSSTTGDFAIFAGGQIYSGLETSENLTNSVTAYSKEGVQVIMDPYEYNIKCSSGTGKNGIGIVAGGYGGNPNIDETNARAEVYAYIVE